LLLAQYGYEFAHNANHLETVLDDARREAVERLFTKGLGVDLNKLSLNQKRFLGM